MFPRTKNLQLSVIKQIENIASQYPDIISLAQGIPSFDTPGCIKRRVERALKRGVVAKYSLSAGLPELRELIEISLARENMFYDWQTEIIVTAGSIEAITAAVFALTEPGDEIIIFDPTYTSYREVIILAGCTPVYVGLDESKNWSLDPAKIEAAITPKTKAIFFCNPNNPTGTIFSRQQLLELSRIAEEHNLYIISDEVYKDFVYDGQKLFSLAELPALRQRVIRIFSFSKAYSMTGWRAAYLHSDESVVREILKVHDSLVTCAPVISQYAAMGALEMGERDLAKFKAGFETRRDYACARLDKLNRIFSYVKPDSAYFIFPKLINQNLVQRFSGEPAGKGLSWNLALALITEIHVAFVPGVAFGPASEGHLRINFGRTEKDISTAFNRLEKLWREYI